MIINSVQIKFKDGQLFSYDEVEEIFVDYKPSDDDLHRKVYFKRDNLWPKETIKVFDEDISRIRCRCINQNHKHKG
jgi:hypothetical protein